MIVTPLTAAAAPPAAESRLAVFEPFNSRGLQFFMDQLFWIRNSQILDTGPICGNNITFLAERCRRLYVFDLFRDLLKKLADQMIAGGEDLWKSIDYGQALFEGIILWHLGDHLTDQSFDRIARLCHVMLKPEGLLAIYACDKPVMGVIHGFRILQNSTLQPYSSSHPALPLVHRSNRELIGMLDRFNLLRSFIYRNGVREFVFRKV